VALTSAVIISAILLAITASMSTTGFVARFNVLDAQYKEQSLALAEGCAHTALLKLAGDRTYTGNETVNVGMQTCRILPVTESGGQFTVKTTASVPEGGTMQTVTNLIVLASSTNIGILSWEEVPNHP
jgi:hypothetical protein